MQQNILTKLWVPQTILKFLGNPKVHDRVHKILPLTTTFYQMAAADFFSTLSNNPPSKFRLPRSLKVCLLKLYALFSSTLCMIYKLHPPWFDRPNNIWRTLHTGKFHSSLLLSALSSTQTLSSVPCYQELLTLHVVYSALTDTERIPGGGSTAQYYSRRCLGAMNTFSRHPNEETKDIINLFHACYISCPSHHSLGLYCPPSCSLLSLRSRHSRQHIVLILHAFTGRP